ncbi:hypothetical protein F5Y00DRAFT_274504 [Daldinia vernicosa]|uniref:uncharacterized protein n=1 Tax=Daldinia vernicosa TaxID=114800 RepID=UPI0020077037|nr:uncharacterized protein F5Y00DRAFT_274504 [Daldinia vernicosa]KAI0844027.1 hypothetical protein F5Y00DRAFT_274504 [Daldinia vernicosa]
MASPISPVAELVPETLLEIFKRLAEDGDATLVPSVLCCRKWQPLALCILYDDVVLNQQRLIKFVENCADHEIRSLTLHTDAIPINPYDPTEARQTAEARLEALRRLRPRITRLKPISISIVVHVPFPYMASSEISSIIDSLPASCISLEVDMRYGSNIQNLTVDSQPHSHMCDAIRAILPRLQHIRLRLPRICPVIFSAESPSQNAHRQPIRAAGLKTCLINFSQRLLSTGLEKTRDWVSSLDILETLAEGSSWIETTTGARLPIAMLRENQDTREALS